MSRPFADAAAPPTDEGLRAALGPTFDGYRSVLDQSAGFARDWSFSKSGGWMLKVHRRGKALVYLIPLDGGFRLSMAIREAERDALAGDPGLAPLHELLATARRFPEGFGIALDVSGDTDPAPIHAFLDRLIELRA